MSKLSNLDENNTEHHYNKSPENQQGESMFLKSQYKSLALDRLQTEIDRLETNFLGWLTIAGIFIIGAGVIKDLVEPPPI